MTTTLQLQKKKAEAAARVETARSALATAKTDSEIARASADLASALRDKIDAGEAQLAASSGTAPAAKMTVTKHVKHEEKTVEREEDPPADEPEDEPEEPEGQYEKAEDSASDMPDDEEDEDEKALAKAYAAPSSQIRASGKLDHALYTPERLLRLVKQATGARTIKGAFGALDAMGQRIAAVEKTEKRIAALEAENRASKVEAAIAVGRKAGKVGGKEHEARLRADGNAQGVEWLKGHLAAAPVVMRTTELQPRTDQNGNAVASLPDDAEKMIAQATAGMPEADAAAFRARVVAQHNQTINGVARRPTH